MRIFVHGNKEDYEACVSCLGDVPELQYRRIEYTHTSEYDGFIEALTCGENKTDLIIVVADGAAGMEAVMASKRMSDGTSVVWVSDDAEFGAQSYRLGCTFFAVKPVSTKMMESAIRKYSKERVGLNDR